MPPRNTGAPDTDRIGALPEGISRNSPVSAGSTLSIPAFYDRDRQEIVCSCDLERFSWELAASQRRHRQTRDRLRAQERAWDSEYSRQHFIPQKLAKPRLAQQLASLDEVDRANEHANSRRTRSGFSRPFTTKRAMPISQHSSTGEKRRQNAQLAAGKGLAQIFPKVPSSTAWNFASAIWIRYTRRTFA